MTPLTSMRGRAATAIASLLILLSACTTTAPRDAAGSFITAWSASQGFSAQQERYRLEINEWIRHQAPFDGVIDFDALMTGGGVSPTGAQIIKPEYSCDFIHPNAAGYRVIGAAIDLKLFE